MNSGGQSSHTWSRAQDNLYSTNGKAQQPGQPSKLPLSTENICGTYGQRLTTALRQKYLME